MSCRRATAPACSHREVLALPVHLGPIYSASAASLTTISKIFVLQELDFFCWREPEPHMLGGPGCLWRPLREGALVPGSYASPVPQELSPTPCQHPLPELPNVAMAPGLCFWFLGMEEGLFFILEGHPPVTEKENKPPKEGLCFGWGFQIAHTLVR